VVKAFSSSSSKVRPRRCDSRTLNVATLKPVYAVLGRPASPRALAEFGSQVSVRVGPGSLLHLTFTDPDPRAAQAGAQALGQALLDNYVKDEEREAQMRIAILTSQEEALTNDLRSASRDLERFVSAYGTLDLEYLWRARFAELSTTERETERLTLSGDAATRPAALAQLKEREERQSAALRKLGADNLALKALRERIDALQREIDPLHERVRTMSLSRLAGGQFRLLDDGKLPLTPAIDDRVRNVTLGGLGGGVVFFLLRGLVRVWRWRRAMGGKTGFPIFKPEPPAPRPAIAIDAAETGSA